MRRPGGAARPRDATAPLPVTSDMLGALAQAIAGGVKYVQYGDRRIDFMSLDELLRAYEWLAGQLGATVAVPVRRGASFSKGLTPTYYATGVGGLEHQEVADVLWSRQAPERSPDDKGDTDWERH